MTFSSTLKVEVARISEMSAYICQYIRHRIQEDSFFYQAPLEIPVSDYILCQNRTSTSRPLASNVIVLWGFS